MASVRTVFGLVLLALSLPLSGCVSLEPAHIPDELLDDEAGNGWEEDASERQGPDGGPFSKMAVRVYKDQAENARGYPGVLLVQSVKGTLSPDRGTLRDELASRLREEASSQGLEVEEGETRGERRLAGGATSFYVLLNATGTSESFLFSGDAEVRGIGEVFRCTGGATVLVKGFAQVDQASSIGGVQTSRNYEPDTWREMVRDPQGTIQGFQGTRGLIYNIACP